MKIGELEQASGLPRASIRFYEKEGLLEPERRENGYREYSEADLETLKKVLLLRSLQVPLKDIRALQAGEDSLGQVLERQLSALSAQRSELDEALRVCRALREAKVDYRDLPAQQYLDSFGREPRAAVAKEDRLPRVQAPVRRFFARELDLFLYSALWGAFLALVCNVGVRSHRGLLALLDLAVPLLLMLVTEPLLLHVWGTTPGKWLLGLSVTDPEGGLLPYSDGLSRTGQIIVRGMGLRIPVISLIRLWKSYRACDDEDRPLSWEEDSQLNLRDEKPWRAAAYVCAVAAVFALLYLAFSAAAMPLHRGDLTTAEFSANFNRLARFFDYDFDGILDPSGCWTKDPAAENIYVLDLGGTGRAPDFVFREGAAGIEEIAFHYESSGILPSSCQRQMQLAVLSFACAQKGFGLFSGARKELLRTVSDHPWESFRYAHGGITLECTAETQGYRTSRDGNLFPATEEDRYFRLYFRLAKDG